MKAESRCVRYSDECPEGRFFEAGEEIPDWFYRRQVKKKVVKKRKYTKKSKFWDDK